MQTKLLLTWVSSVTKPKLALAIFGCVVNNLSPKPKPKTRNENPQTKQNKDSLGKHQKGENQKKTKKQRFWELCFRVLVFPNCFCFFVLLVFWAKKQKTKKQNPNPKTQTEKHRSNNLCFLIFWFYGFWGLWTVFLTSLWFWFLTFFLG